MKWKSIIYFVLFFCSIMTIGFWVGQTTSRSVGQGGSCRPPVQGEVDVFYKDVLKISASQEAKIMTIEASYQEERDRYTEQMHDANLRLAEVIDQDGYESKKIEPLVAEIHSAMGDLQALSLSHLAEIEKVLEPAQAALLKQNAVTMLRQN